jgi:putative CocE/NonD family hydrolase
MIALRFAAVSYLIVCWTNVADAQRFSVPATLNDSTVLVRAMPALAEQMIGRYADSDRERKLDNLFRLQIVGRHYEDAARSVAELRALRTRSASARPTSGAADVQYEIWARAMGASARSGRPFDEAFATAFREVFATLDDQTATLVIRALSVGPQSLEPALRNAVQRQNGRTEIALTDALALIRAYQRFETHRTFVPRVAPLINEDDARRYVTERDVRVRAADGAIVCALLMRPRTPPVRRPALLTFTIYVDSAVNVSDVRRAASNGYVGVTGFTRGKACSPQTPVPYRYDGADAAALIEWIAAQTWSDGRVGMYGGSYNGFTTWAATKRMPKALKAIMVGAPAGPGLDVPMEGNIVWNFIYPWTFYTTNNKTLDNATYFDNARWFKLNREWYVNGRAYRDLEKIDGTPNPIFADWISHPSYDTYWQATIPYGKEFAKVNIPVLQTAGYYFGGPGAAIYYLKQHYAHNPRARHYLLIGPYDHPQAQRGVVSALGDTTTSLAGYEIDPVARIDIVADLRYQWFDWVLKGGSRPALLTDRINYQVMGANEWKHAPSIEAMSNDRLRLHLSSQRSGNAYRLTRARPATDTSVTLRVNLAYRADIDSNFTGGGVRDTAVNTYEALEVISDPIDRPTEVSGLYSGHLEFVTNKKDFDVSIALFELTRKGEYYQLPPFQMRASYARDLSTRHLLTPGKRETIDFKAIRLVSRKLKPGSRIVAVVGTIKGPGQQINYGTGKDVSDETIADAGAMLEIRWIAGSYIDLPIRR